MKNRSLTRSTERGQSLPELAIGWIIVIIMVVGVADFGRAFFTWVELRDAVEEGAVFGSAIAFDPARTTEISKPFGCDAIINRVLSTSSQPVDLAKDASVQVSCAVTGKTDVLPQKPVCYGDTLNVTIIYNDFQVTTPMAGALFGSQQITLTSTARQTVLAPACSQ